MDADLVQQARERLEETLRDFVNDGFRDEDGNWHAGPNRVEAMEDVRFLADAVETLTRERDEARDIVEQLRRHGGNWIVEAVRPRIAALEAALRRQIQAVRDFIEAEYPMGTEHPADHSAHLLDCSADDSHAALAGVPVGDTARIGETVFQWLIERGQPECQASTVWLENSGRHPTRDMHWTQDARQAAMFPTRETADDYIYEHLTHPTRGPSARAVEHGFMTPAGETHRKEQT